MTRPLTLALALSLSTTAAAAEGYRITDMEAATGLSLHQQLVVGQNGGTNLTLLSARLRLSERMMFQVGVPWAAYRQPYPLGRTADVGNLLFEGWYLLETGDAARGIGVQVHVNPGSHAYTWTNDPTQLWPGTGADVLYQAKLPGSLGLFYRGLAGVHVTSDYQPFPRTWLRLGAAAGVDYDLTDRYGLTAEGSFTYWDTSPLEVSGLFRAEVLDGLRLRAGLVFPLAVWVGATPAPTKAGLREATLFLDARFSL